MAGGGLYGHFDQICFLAIAQLGRPRLVATRRVSLPRRIVAQPWRAGNGGLWR